MDIKILHHDKDIVICVKPVGVASENTENKDGLPDLLAEQLGEKIGVTKSYDIIIVDKYERKLI